MTSSNGPELKDENKWMMELNQRSIIYRAVCLKLWKQTPAGGKDLLEEPCTWSLRLTS